MRTSSGARASASGTHTRRFSFRRACEWNLIRRGAQGGQGAGPPSVHRVPTTGPCGMLYWRSTAASSESDRAA